MSGRQKLSRMMRPASSYIWRHSAAGSRIRRIRERSTATPPSLPPSSSSAATWLSDGTTRSLPRVCRTSRLPSPLTAKSETPEASSSQRSFSRSYRSRTVSGRPESGVAALVPSTPVTGWFSHSSPSFAARSVE